MFSHIHVITRNHVEKSHESDWSIFFLIGQFFILKNVQPKIHFCFWDANARWPGLLRCCVRVLCVLLHIFCAAFCIYFLLLFFPWFGFLNGVNISFFGVVSAGGANYYRCSKKKLKKILKKGPTATFLFKKNTPGCILKKLESLLDCLLLVGWLVGWLVGDGACLRCCCCYFCCCHFAVVILLLLFCCC